MNTVYDLMRHHTALEVVCTNCDNSNVVNNRFLTNRFLTNRFGTLKVLTELSFVCHLCQSRNFRLRLVPDHLAERAPLRMQWYRGVYEKFRD